MDALRDELRHLDTTRPALRRFGIVVGAAFGLLAAVLTWRAGAVRPVPLTLGGLGTALLILGAVAPRVLRGPYLGWMALAVGLGFVVSRVLLTVVFVVLVTPTGLVLRALGRAPLTRRPDPEAATYWAARSGERFGPEHYERFY